MLAVSALALAFLVSALSIRYLAVYAPRWGLVDKPGGHKRHEDHVPIVGGLGIFASFIILAPLLYLTSTNIPYPAFATAVLLLVVVGLIDDVMPLSARMRLVIQATAALVMILWGGVSLIDLGYLVSTEQVLVLGAFSIAVTIFGTSSVINALNMMDGIDGLAGALSFIVLGMMAVVTLIANRLEYLTLILCLMGAVGGFLLYNLRRHGRQRATVFMGDAGSTALGLAFAWLLIALSQGPERAMTPVTSIWLICVPLIDTAAVMLRRKRMGRSMFSPDRMHLHHLLIDAGFRVSQTVVAIVGLQLMLGSIALLALYQQVPEPLLFGGFMCMLVSYCFAINFKKEAVVRVLRRGHQGLGLSIAGVKEIYIGNLNQATAQRDLKQLLGDLADQYVYRLYMNEQGAQSATAFAVLDVKSIDNVAHIRRYLKRRNKAMRGNMEIDQPVIRQFIPRSTNSESQKDTTQSGMDGSFPCRRTQVLSPEAWEQMKGDVQITRLTEPDTPLRQTA